MITVTVNGVSVDQYRRQSQRPMTEEEHKRRIVRAHIVTRRIVNHSNARSGRCRVIFHREAI